MAKKRTKKKVKKKTPRIFQTKTGRKYITVGKKRVYLQVQNDISERQLIQFIVKKLGVRRRKRGPAKEKEAKEKSKETKLLSDPNAKFYQRVENSKDSLATQDYVKGLLKSKGVMEVDEQQKMINSLKDNILQLQRSQRAQLDKSTITALAKLPKSQLESYVQDYNSNKPRSDKIKKGNRLHYATELYNNNYIGDEDYMYIIDKVANDLPKLQEYKADEGDDKNNIIIEDVPDNSNVVLNQSAEEKKLESNQNVEVQEDAVPPVKVVKEQKKLLQKIQKFEKLLEEDSEALDDIEENKQKGNLDEDDIKLLDSQHEVTLESMWITFDKLTQMHDDYEILTGEKAKQSKIFRRMLKQDRSPKVPEKEKEVEIEEVEQPKKTEKKKEKKRDTNKQEKVVAPKPKTLNDEEKKQRDKLKLKMKDLETKLSQSWETYQEEKTEEAAADMRDRYFKLDNEYKKFKELTGYMNATSNIYNIIRDGGQEGSGSKAGGHQLTNTEIDEYMRKYPDYIETIPRDGIQKYILPKAAPHSRVAFIINTDKEGKPGKHWQAIFIDARPKGSKSVEFYDSFAEPIKPELLKDIKMLVDKMSPDVYLKFKENKIINQFSSTNNCGYFAMQFITDRLEGKPFPDCTGYSAATKSEKDIEKWKSKLKIKPFGYL